MALKFSADSATVGETDTNGFLKIKLRVAMLGVLPYDPTEIEGFEELDRPVNILRDEAELFDPTSMASLEGVPLLIGHTWLVPGSGDQPVAAELAVNPIDAAGLVQVGQIAGAPKRDGDFLLANGLITNRDAIAAIENRKIIEISSAFVRRIVPDSGVWHDQKYDAKYAKLRYNHVALLPPGEGRGGSKLRITEDKKKGKNNMADIIVKTPHGNITTDEAGSAVLGRVMDAAAADAEEVKKNKDQLVGLEEKVEKIKELDAKIAELTTERDKIRGELDGVKAELEKITSPEAIQELVTETVETQDAAETLEKQGTIDALPHDWKRLPISQIREIAVKSYLARAGRAIDSEKLTDDYISGAWKSLQLNISGGQHVNVPVAGAVRSMDNTRTSSMRSFAERMGYPVKKKQGDK